MHFRFAGQPGCHTVLPFHPSTYGPISLLLDIDRQDLTPHPELPDRCPPDPIDAHAEWQRVPPPPPMMP